MANPFEDCSDDERELGNSKGESEKEIMEGLICPNCMSKFNTEKDLLNHFNDENKDETSPKLSSSLKEILGKAKKRIFESGDDSSVKPTIEPDYDEFWRKNQGLGCFKTHWSVFKKRRESKIENCVIETNKLLIRLDKLLREVPSSIIFFF